MKKKGKNKRCYWNLQEKELLQKLVEEHGTKK